MLSLRRNGQVAVLKFVVAMPQKSESHCKPPCYYTCITQLITFSKKYSFQRGLHANIKL